MTKTLNFDEEKTPVVDFVSIASTYKEAYEKTSHQLDISEEARKSIAARTVKALNKLNALKDDLGPGTVERAAVDNIIRMLRNGE